MTEIKKPGIDYRLVIILIAYAIIIGISWGNSQNNINDNSDDILYNKKYIESNGEVIMSNQLDINTLSVQLDNMIDLQKEMNETLKQLK
jgi:hypothetical protein